MDIQSVGRTLSRAIRVLESDESLVWEAGPTRINKSMFTDAFVQSLDKFLKRGKAGNFAGYGVIFSGKPDDMAAEMAHEVGFAIGAAVDKKAASSHKAFSRVLLAWAKKNGALSKVERELTAGIQDGAASLSSRK